MLQKLRLTATLVSTESKTTNQRESLEMSDGLIVDLHRDGLRRSNWLGRDVLVQEPDQPYRRQTSTR